MNKIRTKLDEIVREAGNKLSPHVMTGKLSGKEYGFGDLLTYRLGYRHLGVTIGASAPLALSSIVTGSYNNLSALLIDIITYAPLEAIGGFFGYLIGFCGDIMRTKYKNRK